MSSSSSSLSTSSTSDDSLSSLMRIKAPKLISDEYYPTWKLLLTTYLIERKLLLLLKIKIDSATWKSMCASTDDVELELLMSGVTSHGGTKRNISNIPTIKKELQSSESKSGNIGNSQSSPINIEINKHTTYATGKIRQLYSILFDALPNKLQIQIAPENVGNGVWLWYWLEEKLEANHIDMVHKLNEEILNMRQSDTEKFSEYKSRVDRLNERLSLTHDDLKSNMYRLIVLSKLRPEYKSIIQIINTNHEFKDVEGKHDEVWHKIELHIGSHEREFARVNGEIINDETATAMSAQFKPKFKKEDWKKDRTCFNCQEKGHMNYECTKPKKPRYPNNYGHAKSAMATKSSSDDRSSMHEDDSSQQFTFSAIAVKSNELKLNIAAANIKVSNTKLAVSSSTSSITNKTDGSKPPDKLIRIGERVLKPHPLLSTPMSTVVSTTDSTTRSQLLQNAKKPGPTNSRVGKPIDVLLKEYSWGIDTMASLHCTGNKNHFATLRKCSPIPITCANGDKIYVEKVGRVKIRVTSEKGNIIIIDLDEVYYSPDMTINLISGMTLAKLHNTDISTENGKATLIYRGTRIPLSTRGNILTLNGGATAMIFSAIRERVISDINELVATHVRLGHVGFDRMITIIKSQKSRGVGILKLDKDDIAKARDLVMNCTACKLAKTTDTPYSGNATLNHGSSVGEVIHFDSFECRLSNGTVHYGLIIVEPYSGALQCHKLLSKDQIVTKLIISIKFIETIIQHKIKFLYSDGGTEFNNHTLIQYCQSNGMTYHYPPATTPKWNGIAERAVRTVKEGGRTLLKQSGLPDWSFWYHAVCHFIYVWNRTYISKYTGITPYESFYKQKPSVNTVNVFGCDVFVWMNKIKRDHGTFASRGEPGVYLGHDSKQQCAIVWLLKTQKEIRTRSVQIGYRQSQFNYASAIKLGPDSINEIINRSNTGGTLAWTDIDITNNEMNMNNDDDMSTDELKSDELSDDKITDSDSIEIDDDMNKQWEVESIINHRALRNKPIQFEIKWVNHSKPTWEPIGNLVGTCDELLNEYRLKNKLPIDDDIKQSIDSSSVASSSQ